MVYTKEQKNIQLEEWSLAEIEIWRKKQGEELELCKTKWKKAFEQKENEQTKIAVLQEKIDELMEQKDEITNDIELYRYIEFYKNQPESFDIQIQLDERKKQIQKLENEQKKHQVQIDQYQDIAGIDMETVTKSRDDQIKGLEKSKMEAVTSVEGRRVFWLDATLPKHITHRTVILSVFPGNGAFPLQVFFFHIVVCHFRCEVLCGNCEGGQKISQRTAAFYAKAVFHFRCRR